ncbi:MAG: toprim domain-containing protein [Ignavibacteriaceae bacterium]|nr:toprim domain-containing protein [Ignavibacteriaceae bacterium]
MEYLDNLGHKPEKVRGDDHWYFSPFRKENTPSFKVNKKFNVWYDHGVGKGGNLIDFGILYHNCSVREFLQKLNGNLFFQQPEPFSQLDQKKQTSSELAEEKNKIKILSVSEIQSPALIDYLETRRIPLQLAREYSKQVEFELYDKKITVLGFPNRSGGYELRNANFKGSNSPKDVSFVDHGKDQVAVFEGFFSYLSFLKINGQEPPLTNFLILNSLSFLEKSRELMERHEDIHLFLDRDTAGKNAAEKALQWGEKYRDRSDFYSQHKDLNEWLGERWQASRQSQRRGRRL